MKSLFLFFSSVSVVLSTRSCPGGWTTFNRTSGPWCVRVSYGVFTRDLANEICKTLDAQLTGVENSNERMIIAEEARSIINENRRRTESIEVAGVWLGATKTSACLLPNSCPLKNSFAWTDGVTSGTDGFQFPSTAVSQYRANCLQQIVFASLPTNSDWPGYQHGDYNSAVCSSVENPVYKLYACGKSP